MANFEFFMRASGSDRQKITILSDNGIVADAVFDEEERICVIASIFDDQDTVEEALTHYIYGIYGETPRFSYNEQVEKNIQKNLAYQRGHDHGAESVMIKFRQGYEKVAQELKEILDIVETIIDQETKQMLQMRIQSIENIIKAEIVETATDTLTRLFKKNIFDAIMGTRQSDASIKITTDMIKINLSKAKHGDRVCLIDLNNFKSSNDLCGYAVGDQVLSIVGKEMKQRFPQIASFRIGGDEFAMLIRKEQIMMDSSIFAKISNFFRVELESIMFEAIPELKKHDIPVSGSLAIKEYDGHISLADFMAKLNQEQSDAKILDKAGRGYIYDRDMQKSIKIPEDIRFQLSNPSVPLSDRKYILMEFVEMYKKFGESGKPEENEIRTKKIETPR